jgi:hypothetical protein
MGIYYLNIIIICMYNIQKYIEKPIQLLSFDSLGHAILNK